MQALVWIWKGKMGEQWREQTANECTPCACCIVLFPLIVQPEENCRTLRLILHFQVKNEAIIPSGCVIEKSENKKHLMGGMQINEYYCCWRNNLHANILNPWVFLSLSQVLSVVLSNKDFRVGLCDFILQTYCARWHRSPAVNRLRALAVLTAKHIINPFITRNSR